MVWRLVANRMPYNWPTFSHLHRRSVSASKQLPLQFLLPTRPCFFQYGLMRVTRVLGVFNRSSQLLAPIEY